MAFPGGCLCGACRFHIERKYINAMHCYCGMCRKAHGTAFSTHVIVRPDQLRWESDRSALRTYESSPQGFREFCAGCGSHVLIHGQTDDGNLAIPLGILDGDPPVTLLGHMFIEDCVSWFRIDDELPRHTRWPPGF